jgi:hypothetical protein
LSLQVNAIAQFRTSSGDRSCVSYAIVEQIFPSLWIVPPEADSDFACAKSLSASHYHRDDGQPIL